MSGIGASGATGNGPDHDPASGEPPPLAARLTDPVPVVLAGSAVWAVLAIVLGVLALTGSRPLGVWFAAALVGVGLGALGLGVLALQRRAARRGDRGAQQL